MNIRKILPYTLIETSDIILSSENTTGLLKEFVNNDLIDIEKDIIETDYGFGIFFKKKEAAIYLNQRVSRADYYNIFQCEICNKWYFNNIGNMKKKIINFNPSKDWFPITCSRKCQNYVHNVIHNVGAKRLQQYYEEHPENQGKWARQWREDNPKEAKEVLRIAGVKGGKVTGSLQAKAAQICNGNIEPISEDERIWAEKYMKIKKSDCSKAAKELTDRMWNANNPHYHEYEGLRNKALLALDNTKYNRDEYGNITHIDGIPIEEKYQIIKNRHWILPSGEITSNQQKAIYHKGEPVDGPRGYLRDNDGNITHIDGIPIEEIYKSVENKIIDIDNSFFILTGRNQNSNSWEGKEAFDQFLINQNIGWFVYIKFDIIGNPLVVGKTGTLKVSNSINDIVFDYWESNHGPARQYLRDNNLDWDKTKILVVPCCTEQEALNKEKEIHDKYSLFYS